MKKQVGDKNFQVWLLGDSNPKNWQTVLETPLDPRHPARHNIWTPVLERIQDHVFRACKFRVDTSSLFIRNAIEDPAAKPRSNSVEWNTVVEREIRLFSEMISAYCPRILFSFGAFAFEFARRALDERPKQSHSYWGANKLGQEFKRRVERFDSNVMNLLPLLHASIARGRFIQSHEYFCNQEGANYFEVVGSHVAQKLVKHRDELEIWIGD